MDVKCKNYSLKNGSEVALYIQVEEKKKGQSKEACMASTTDL
jgi:hypothetical protein